MKVSDILQVKGKSLHTITPDDTLAHALGVMHQKDMGSLVVLERGALVGILTFREVIQQVVKNGGAVGASTVRVTMDASPLTCGPETELDDVRRMMLEKHARYMPVLEGKAVAGVISFYDVAKAVVDAQDFENKMLKAYIRDWPEETSSAAKN